MSVVVLISADAEWRAAKKLYPDLEIQPSPLGEFAPWTLAGERLTLFHGGWGKISAAASAQYAIDRFQPRLLVNLGTCGGFAGRIQVGTILLVERTVVYDVIEQMGDAEEALRHYAAEIDLSWLPNKDVDGVLRSLLVSADRDVLPQDIPMLIEKYGAAAADWESGAIAWAANRNRTRVLILRGVTDLVGGDGGEAYGDLALFHQRTESVMRRLFALLPLYLRGAAFTTP